MIETDRIYNEDCLLTMERMPSDFVDLIVTSPPYDDVRDYDGHSQDFEFEPTADELIRIVKPGGVVVWVAGDRTIEFDESGTSFRQALYFKEVGFKLFDTMIYKKRNIRVSGNMKSYLQVFEYMFVLSKGVPKTTNLIADRKNKYPNELPARRIHRNQDGSMKYYKPKTATGEYGKRFNIWEYKTGMGMSAKNLIAHDHPAIFPEQLAYDHIVSWSNRGDLVYDPFSGSGTVALMARQTGRRYIGSEINQDYFELSLERVGQPMLALEHPESTNP